jgi:hypothetical protein
MEVKMIAIITRAALSKLTRKLVDTRVVKKVDGAIYGKVSSSSGWKYGSRARIPAHLIFKGAPFTTLSTPTSTYFTYVAPTHIVGHFTSRSNNTNVSIPSNIGGQDGMVCVDGPMGENFVTMLTRLDATFPGGVPEKGKSKYL